MQEPKKAIECLECPERWPRLINGYGHFRERCDVTKRHLAKLWNFETLRPKINPCPMEQPQPRCTLPHSCRNPKKQSNILCPKRWPRLINGYGHFRERCDVTKRHLARLCNFGTLRPKINPCPMEQPQPRCTLPHSCRNPKKRLSIWHVPFRDVSAVC